MKKTVFIAMLALLAVVLSPPDRAAAAQWEFDRAHSSFFFDIKHIFYTTRGYFEDYRGTFRFDPDQPDDSRIDITIATKSITTQHKKRDQHLRSDDFFDVKRFPSMRFESRRIRHLGGGNYAVDGRLTIKDVARDITVPFRLLGVRENPFDADQLVAGFEARFTIDRLEYHVGSGKYYEMGAVGKDVDILISLEMLRDK